MAEVECQGQDVATEQVRSGLAWFYVRYGKGYEHLGEMEAEARDARRGLWSVEAVAPWDWRRGYTRAVMQLQPIGDKLSLDCKGACFKNKHRNPCYIRGLCQKLRATSFTQLTARRTKMKKHAKFLAALISGLGATATIFAVPTFQRPTGTDLSRMRGDAERVGATMRSVIERERDNKTAEARS